LILGNFLFLPLFYWWSICYSKVHCSVSCLDIFCSFSCFWLLVLFHCHLIKYRNLF
jgi:hypothetical protein